MVWEGITMTGRTALHICQGNVTGLYYIDNVTETTVVPYARRHRNVFIFQDDNARTHYTCVIQDHQQFCRFRTLPRTATCLDLSPIECLWDILRKRVRRRPLKPLDIQLSICGTTSRDVSGDVLTSHWTSTSSLLHSRKNGAGSPKQPLGGSSSGA